MPVLNNICYLVQQCWWGITDPEADQQTYPEQRRFQKNIQGGKHLEDGKGLPILGVLGLTLNTVKLIRSESSKRIREGCVDGKVSPRPSYTVHFKKIVNI